MLSFHRLFIYSYLQCLEGVLGLLLGALPGEHLGEHLHGGAFLTLGSLMRNTTSSPSSTTSFTPADTKPVFLVNFISIPNFVV